MHSPLNVEIGSPLRRASSRSSFPASRDCSLSSPAFRWKPRSGDVFYRQGCVTIVRGARRWSLKRNKQSSRRWYPLLLDTSLLVPNRSFQPQLHVMPAAMGYEELVIEGNKRYRCDVEGCSTHFTRSTVSHVSPRPQPFLSVVSDVGATGRQDISRHNHEVHVVPSPKSSEVNQLTCHLCLASFASQLVSPLPPCPLN